jgi:hypothetical protein
MSIKNTNAIQRLSVIMPELISIANDLRELELLDNSWKEHIRNYSLLAKMENANYIIKNNIKRLKK